MLLLAPVVALSAPYADLVMDMRTGEVLRSENADTKLHPASLTKMMTLYIAFEAIERGEISLDSRVTISRHAASQPPSKLGLRAGQTIALRYLIRAAAIKSANDAATAIGEAIEGSEPAFAKRMTRTARALGMTRSTFANANGLTAKGHLSTARDMAVLGRHLFYDYPQYYNIFSRRSADAGIAQVNSTNRRFLDSYEGADGIKTGYTVAAGFNLVASAQRGNKRIVASLFGGQSTAQRNARMVQLLDMGFGKSPNRATVQKPARPAYVAPEPEDLLADAGPAADVTSDDPAFDSDGAVAAALASGVAAGKTLRINVAVEKSLRPRMRPLPGAKPAEEPAAEPAEEVDDMLLASMQDDIAAALAEAQETLGTTPEPALAEETTEEPEAVAVAENTAEAPAAEAITVAEAAPLPETGPVFTQSTAPQPETLGLQGAAAELAEVPEGTAVAFAAVAPKPSPLADEAPAASDPIVVASAPLPEAVSEPSADQTDASAIDAAKVAPAAEETVVIAAPEAGQTPAPRARPVEVVLAAAPATEPAPEAPLEVVTRVSTSGGRQWAINVGNFNSRYAAERMLLQTALIEMNTLDESLRKVVPRKGGFDANFVGMTEEMAELACRRLAARQTECAVVGP
ncbi:MAG: serine hydrolase [Proteobacteria bacterium]|nr:serine hydrolase [Pseudomonadota bacterium]